ncbi:MAG: lipid-A-disaccharide synthase [Rickettsiales bacterium]|jgi:lipid-A-disaccharide synthase|nr:lipid-A-disaccharide synthase [Rickettsiales bacterium]
MKKKIFILAGEKSGDLLGSKVIRNLDKRKFKIRGVGGELMENEGLESIFPLRDISVMGFFELLPKLFKILARSRLIVREIIKFQPDILLTIDSPDFCFRIAKKIKKFDKNNKIRKIHLVAPTVWAYREGRAKKISKIYDKLLCLFPFEPPYFEKYGLKTKFVGHPLFYQDSEYEFDLKKIDRGARSNIIVITAGSREGEVRRLLPIILNVVERLRKQRNDLKYYFLATNDTFPLLKDKIGEDGDIKIVKEKEIIGKALLGIAKSGTNALEFGGFLTPCVTCYRFSPLTNLLVGAMRAVAKNKFANIANVMAEKEIVPEFVLGNCRADKICEGVVKLLDSEAERETQRREVKKILWRLGYESRVFSSKSLAEEVINE